ncbi:MAG: chromate transporter [Candidatus Rokuibacteriota bacterium]
MSEAERTNEPPPGAAVGHEGGPRSDTKPPVTLIDLALTFLKIAMVSLGGGMSAWALRVLVEERRWLTDEEFLGALTLCRILPGANQVNLAVHVGTRYRGVAGAAAALAGLTLVPLAIVLVLGGLYFRHHQVPALKDSMSGLVAAAAGMTLAVGVKLGAQYRRDPVAIVLATAAFVGMAVLRWPLLVVLGVLAPIGVIWYWPRGAPGQERRGGA